MLAAAFLEGFGLGAGLIVAIGCIMWAIAAGLLWERV